jgi:phosphatidate cytidylyltransferase
MPRETVASAALNAESIMAIKSVMGIRILLGGCMIFLLLGLLAGDAWLATKLEFPFRGALFSLAVSVLAAMGTRELIALAKNKAISVSNSILIVGVVALITQPVWKAFLCDNGVEDGTSLALIFVLLLMIAALVQGRRHGTTATFVNLGFSCFALTYLGLGFWFLVKIRFLTLSSTDIAQQSGPIILFLLTVKSADIGAYFTGKAIGRHKWVPQISPAKTWEGFIGGTLFACIIASLFTRLFDIIPIAVAVLFGLVIGIFGQLGDLLESMLKRDSGEKDAANLLPAFGGVLDLVDSVVVAAPVAYLVLRWAGPY